jgi:hypothetical protein
MSFFAMENKDKNNIIEYCNQQDDNSKKRQRSDRSPITFSTPNNLLSNNFKNNTNSNNVKEKQNIVSSIKKQKIEKGTESPNPTEPTLSDYLQNAKDIFNSRNSHMLKLVGIEPYMELLDSYIITCTNQYKSNSKMNQKLANKKKSSKNKKLNSTLLDNVTFINRSTKYIGDIENHMNICLKRVKTDLDLFYNYDKNELADRTRFYMDMYQQNKKGHAKYSIEGEEIFVQESIKTWLNELKMTRIEKELLMYKKNKQENLEKLKQKSIENISSKIQPKHQQQVEVKQDSVFEIDGFKCKQLQTSYPLGTQTLPKVDTKQFKNQVTSKNEKYNDNNMNHEMNNEIDDWITSCNDSLKNGYNGGIEDVYSKSIDADDYDLVSLLYSSQDELDKADLLNYM